MKTKNKIITICLISSATISSIAIINKVISLTSDKGILPKENRQSYHWRFGTISYTCQGNGKPLILLHDLLPGNSDVEWKNTLDKLSNFYTVYTLDLLGFGRSDKPAITYTNYLYVQLITDFIKSVIGKRTDIIASGSSSNIAIMACCNDKSLFDRIMLVNPDPLAKTNLIPGRHSKMQKLLLDCPVIGTLLYNIMVSKLSLKKDFSSLYFANPAYKNHDLLNSFYESAHLGGYNAKFIYSSIIGNYTNFSLSHKLGEIDNSIYIIGGAKEPFIKETLNEYQTLNPAIESSLIKESKHFPHIERPQEFLDLCQIFFPTPR